MACWYGMTLPVLLMIVVIQYGESASTKQAYIHCYKNSETQSLMVRASLAKNDDIVEDYYPVDFGTRSKLTTCTSIIYTEREITVTKTLSLSPSPSTLPDSCGFEYLANTQTVRIMFRSHEKLGMNDVDDRYFIFSCSYTSAIDAYLSTVISVSYNNLDKVIQSSRQTLTMEAVLVSSEQSVTKVMVGDRVFLRVNMNLDDTYTEPVDFWGCYMYNCKVSKFIIFPDQSNVTKNIIDSKGCAIQGIDFSPSSGFTSTLTNGNKFISHSGQLTISMYRPPDNSDLYFQCNLGFCDGIRNANSKCLNYCSSNGRRRRSAEEFSSSNSTYQITLHLTVSHENVNGVSQVSKGSDEVITIGLLVGVVIFILLILTLVIFLFLYLQHRRSKHEKVTNDAHVYPNPMVK
ncbi:hypothetical protein CHS0354_015385 [Potamilus streckersoni]|uniref:ZP domain-containing protein n=1 Tax=Potamilus streckersoni TaxID=2493646 RepID=A0AAE0S182_9BIVA|nr:hypothetical protein CHS0354_015385 [Potamilus streckersoni]